MAETNQEPTMEEILASIRRIISEDDAPSEPAKAPAPPPPATPEPVVAPPPLAIEDDILELTDRLDEPFDAPDPPEISDLEFVAPTPRIEPPVADLPPLPHDEPLVGQPAAYSAASAFEALERSILMPGPGRTLEDVVREMLRPLLKAWLDAHLPGIVEAQVAAEVERIARLRR